MDPHVFFGCAVVGLIVPLIIPALLRAWDIGAALDQAIRETPGYSRKQAAFDLGISEQQLSRAILGKGPEALSADRLTRLPRLVALRFLLAWGHQCGVSPDADTRAAHEARRMARQIRAELAHDNAGEVRATA